MNYYYYPLCTKDFTFENIFASESISPNIFYEKRGFGIDYFYLIPKVHHKNVIILFEEPPIYETGSESIGIIKFILEIDRDCLDPTELVNVENGIIAYQNTIYLNKENFKILFFNEVDRKVTLLRSETSLPTKGYRKYISNFKLITASECKIIDTIVEQLKIDNGVLRNAISYDRLYNTFKGFIYGVTAGMLNEKPHGEISVKRSLQDIINCFTEFKNRKETDSNGSGTRYLRTFGTSQSPLKIFYEKLVKAITLSEKLFFDLVPPQIISEEDIAKYLLTKYEKRLGTLEEAMLYVSHKIIDDELTGSNVFVQLKNKYLTETGKKDPSLYFDNLKIIAEKITKEPGNIYWNSDKKFSANSADDFKDVLHDLSNLADQKLFLGKENKRVDLSAISINSAGDEIVIGKSLGDLTDHELEEYQIIVNIIFNKPKFGKGETKKEQVLNIVEETGSKTNKANGGKQTRLYRYLNNEINEYSIENATSIVMKNFVAFVFNIDSLENLENYSDAKMIEKKWISSSFWCLFNGFANINGYFLSYIFDPANEELQNYIDGYLKQISLDTPVKANKLQEANIAEPVEPVHAIKEKKGNKPDKVEEFYNTHVQEKYDIPLDRFISIFQLKNKENILKELKERHEILKKDGKKLIELFIEHVSSRTLFE